VKHQERLDFNTKNIAEFRASGGTLASFGDAPVLLLTTTGARSGQPRTSPMMYLLDPAQPDEHTDPADPASPRLVYVFASAAGDDKNPNWFINLRAHPTDLTVEISHQVLAATAEVLEDPERGRIFDIQATRFPGFRAYQDKTTRVIPVVALHLEPKEPHVP
jgi:deazaflavin-dependent oxidoreductase (nitroreductase family)